MFRLVCRHAGLSPGKELMLGQLQQALKANLGWKQVLDYLKLLDGTLLVRLIEPLELRMKRGRSALKLCLADHSLRAAWLQEVVPLTPVELAGAPHLSDRAGHIAESVAGYFLRSIINLDLAHFPERSSEPEVDYILTVGERRDLARIAAVLELASHEGCRTARLLAHFSASGRDPFRRHPYGPPTARRSVCSRPSPGKRIQRWPPPVR
ncbi:MAG: hypothetical protein HY814_14550 [Candidatus Riflebacteria bacterium]|nr:hypothetical protein [Candidatus Riflebacteria bacterium]